MQVEFHLKVGKSMKQIIHKLLRWLAIGLCLLFFSLLIDWLLFNLYLGCCEGGVCWPDIYPQCRNAHYREFYGDDHGN
jgi:hypothetical protein